MTRIPKVAVVIIHWNRKELLKKFLPGVIDSSYPNLEVILADNASTDGSVEYVKENFPSVKIIVNDGNYGYAGGYNRCLQHVSADYFILLNNDIEVIEGWIEPVIQAMEADPSLGACQPKMLDYHQRNRFEYAGACGGYMDRLGYVFCRGRIFESLEEDHGQYDSDVFIFWATGACMFVRAEAFRKAEGFDEQFFAHMEEVDLCWRMQLLGYKIKVIPSSHVYHVGGGTLNKMNPQKTFLNFRNNIIMLTKNMPGNILIWLIPLRIAMDLLSSVYFLFNGFPRYTLAVFRAHIFYYSGLRKWWKQRNKTPSATRKQAFPGVYQGSIVAAHFIEKKNIFTDLT